MTGKALPRAISLLPHQLSTIAGSWLARNRINYNTRLHRPALVITHTRVHFYCSRKINISFIMNIARKLSNIDEDHEYMRNGEQIRINYNRGDIEEKSSSSHRYLDNTNPCSTNTYPSKDLTNSEQSLHHKPFLMTLELF